MKEKNNNSDEITADGMAAILPNLKEILNDAQTKFAMIGIVINTLPRVCAHDCVKKDAEFRYRIKFQVEQLLEITEKVVNSCKRTIEEISKENGPSL